MASVPPSHVLDAFLDLVAERLADRLTRTGSSGAGAITHYTTNKAGPQAPGKSRRWCRDHFPEIAGARRVGRDWVVSVADFDKWAASRTPSRTSNVVPLPVEPWTPERALERAGIRPTRTRVGP